MINWQNYQISFGTHKNKNVIWFTFHKDQERINQLKNILPVSWSASQKKWYVIDIPSHRKTIGLKPNIVGKQVLSKIHPINAHALSALEKEIKLRGYSPNTLKTYLNEFAQLLYTIKDYPIENLNEKKLESYILYCINKFNLSENQIHSRINAIKFYFEKVIHKNKITLDIQRPKKQKQLPKVLSTQDIIKLFQVVENTKHLLLLKLSYGMGLRVSEIVNLKINNIDINRLQVHIQAAKGKKDRIVPLPQSVIQILNEYYKIYKPKKYLFEGQYSDQYSSRSVQAVFKKAMQKANIKKEIGIHGLRHSYATHLLESGTDISLIKELLGHNDLKTTLTYTHISQKNLNKVKSPLDNI